MTSEKTVLKRFKYLCKNVDQNPNFHTLSIISNKCLILKSFFKNIVDPEVSGYIFPF